MKEEKKKNKGLIITIVILIVLLLASIGYIVYDKFYQQEEANNETEKETEIVPNEEPLVEGHTFNLSNVECTYEDDFCVKKVKVAYNNENHDIKLKLITTEEDTIVDYKIEVSIDDNLVTTLNAGGFQKSDDGNEGVFENFDGGVYVIDEKYLGIITPTYATAGSTGYELSLYNNNKLVTTTTDTTIKVIGQSLCSETCNGNNSINDFEDLEFDGHAFRYWGQDPETYYVTKYSLTFDGTNVNKEKIEENRNAGGSGASY